MEERFRSTFYSEDLEKYNPLPNYNVAPTHVMPVIADKDPEHFLPMRWGLIPFWAKDHRLGYKMINARVETITEKSAFKQAVVKRRCLIPMDGYYEWKKSASGKIPYRIQVTDQEIFSMAGVWENWKSPEGEWIQSYTIITQPSSSSIAEIHDRMPAILPRAVENDWLDVDLPVEDALSLIAPYPDELLRFYAVGNRVGKVSENDAQLIEPREEQGLLF